MERLGDNSGQLHWADIITVVAYFLILITVGVWSSVRASRSSMRGMFLAGRSMTWLPIGASIFASNIGAPVFMGLTGTAAASGIGGLIFEWHAIPFVLALGWIFVPVFISSGVFTMPEYLKRRYGGRRLQIYLSVLSILVYLVTRISVEMYAGAVFVQLIFGLNMYISSIIIVGVSAVFAMSGGLATVLYTDTLQTVVFSVGALVLMITSVNSVGGYNALWDTYMSAVPNNTMNTTCGIPRSDSFSLLRHPWFSDYPWVGTLIVNSAGDIFFWCTDQIMVQRSLSAKSLSHAKGGSLFAGYLKILPFFFFIIPGMAARILYPNEIACVDPDVCMETCENPNGCSNLAYPLLILRTLYPGIRGLMVASVSAACISTLTSVFNSSSSIFTLDIWTNIRRNASQVELVIVGRCVIIVLVGLSIIWLPIMQASQGTELWQYWQSLMSAVGPPWAMIFIWGIFWRKTTEKAAFFGMICGHLIGLTRLILVILYPVPPCIEIDTRPAIVKIHYLYVAAIEIVVTSVIVVSVSFVTKGLSDEELKNLTFMTLSTQKKDVEEKFSLCSINSNNDLSDNLEKNDNTDQIVTCEDQISSLTNKKVVTNDEKGKKTIVAYENSLWNSFRQRRRYH